MIAALGVAVYMSVHASRRFLCAVLFLLVGAAGWINGYKFRLQEQFADAVSGKTGTLTGKIYDIRESTSGEWLYVTATEITGTNADGDETVFSGRMRIIVYLESAENVCLGQTVCCTGVCYRPDSASNPGGFDADKYYGSRGIFLTMRQAEITDKDAERSLFLEGLRRIKDTASEIFEQVFAPAEASTLSAMLLGDKSGLDGEVKKMYQINGIAHILAISGLHIAILGMSLFEFLRKRLGSFTLPGGISLAVVICYGVMTGLAGSTCRAVIMMAVLIGGRIIGRTTDMLTSAGIACVMMAVANPYCIEDAGFQLSFAAVGGIAVVKPALDRIFGAGGRFRQSLFISLSSLATTFPLVVYYYYQFPLYSLILNLIVVPLVSMVLMCGIATATCGFFSIKLAVLPAFPASCILKLYRMLCSLMEHVPGYTINVGHITTDMVVFYYAALLLLLFAFSYGGFYRVADRTTNDEESGRQMHRRRWRFCMAAFFTGMVMLYEIFALDRGFTVCYLDVGQGDGILIRTEEGTHILIDGGSTSEEEVGEYVLLSAIRYYGMADLDYVFVTHGDEDHVSGIRYLLETEHTGIRIRHLVVAKHGDLDSLSELITLAKTQGVTVLYMDVGDEVTETKERSGEDTTIRCISPSEDGTYSDANEASLVLEMETGGHRFLFTGDMGEDTEAELVGTGVLRDCEVLKVGHHGSKYASTAALLDTVLPEYAVISCSKTNSYGHPAEETLARLSDVGAEVHCTMNEGAVIVTLADDKLLLSGYR